MPSIRLKAFIIPTIAKQRKNRARNSISKKSSKYPRSKSITLISAKQKNNIGTGKSNTIRNFGSKLNFKSSKKPTKKAGKHNTKIKKAFDQPKKKSMKKEFKQAKKANQTKTKKIKKKLNKRKKTKKVRIVVKSKM